MHVMPETRTKEKGLGYDVDTRSLLYSGKERQCIGWDNDGNIPWIVWT